MQALQTLRFYAASVYFIEYRKMMLHYEMWKKNYRKNFEYAMGRPIFFEALFDAFRSSIDGSEALSITGDIP